MKQLKLIVIGLLIVVLSGCIGEKEAHQTTSVTPEITIPAKEVASKQAMNQIYTTEKKMALTFNGMADKETMIDLLNELDRFGIKATFFLPGMRVAEEPELASEILDRGHMIQNNTLNHVLPDKLDYESAYVELYLANKVFQEHLDIVPEYVRSRSGDSSLSLEEASAQLGMRVVSNTINPRDSQMQSAEEIATYIKRFSTRGAIIQLNTYTNPEVIRAIELIYEDAVASGYTLTTLEEVKLGNYLVEDTINTNNLVVNRAYEDTEPVIIEKFSTTKKEIALTFDDWASDETISAVLDILNDYQIQSTFFLIGNGVEKNPQLARLIVEQGHEVASHSYNHKVVVSMNPEELQEDLVKNDEILSYALQEKPLNMFRPAQGIMDDETANVITATGVEYIVLYDVASLDWNLSLTEEEVFNRVIEKTGPGSIINMHILDESHTVQLLPKIIEHLQQQGYVFRKISEMISDYRVGGS
ncbi:polysaccharide deacetylase family protein [Paucisalibacillus sp. EB02]|uniref:polysaccharide deacetylase family protein n=1 Tax=Paucisalibacillus sp. EB02 TaxID=1347087 RepID=UPI0004B8BD9F|nr:polysaccharide deacetylase family protein [Paucisalibacillus sp. EB02]